MAIIRSKPSQLLALLACLAAVPSAARAGGAGPFDGLSGSWTGGGSAALANGALERVRCEATYAVSSGGDSLDQDLRCSSDRDNFDFQVQLANQGGSIVGNWNELTHEVRGGVSGHGSDGLIQVAVRGQAFSAEVAVTTRGGQQSVTIRAQGDDLSAVSIVLRRAR